MDEKHTTRIDKWLWTVRIYKTRALATKACASGKVKIEDTVVKASRKILIDEIVQVRKGVVKYLYRVRKTAEKRMGVKLVPDFMDDLTPKEELAKLKSSQRQTIQIREKGQGRPTKKERRVLEKYHKKY